MIAQVLVPLLLTLKVATWAIVLALLAGVALARLLAGRTFFGRDVLDAFCTLPLVLPPTVLGYYLIVLLGRQGIFGRWLDQVFGFSFMFTWQGAVVAATVVAFPLVYKSSRAALEAVPASCENAARTLGATELEVFLRVSFPMALRGILAGTMLAFARAMGEFGATLMIAGNLPGRTQTLSLAVYSAVQAGRNDLANVMVLVISAVCVTILVVTARLITPKF
ncbi:MAG: molybdenum ABC transporter permease subunit [Desulfobulbaceae bacterium A2]|nr:MAG: molybdenum ABC transporter permease subunit [Desulfobulbaceae bacterium A2]